jgi:hypothetical protein
VYHHHHILYIILVVVDIYIGNFFFSLFSEKTHSQEDESNVRASGSCYIRIKCSAISFELGQPPPLPSLGKKKYSRPTNQTVADQCTGHRGHHHRLRKDERGMCSKKKRSQLSKGWASPMLSFDSELFAFFFFLFSPFLFFLFFFFLYCTQEPIRSSIDISIQSPSERFYFIFIFS